MIQLLKRLKLFDADGTLSLSSLSLIVTIVRLAIAPTLDWTVLMAIFLTLLNYNARKVFRFKDEEKTVNDQSRLSHLEKAITDLRTAQALRR